MSVGIIIFIVYLVAIADMHYRGKVRFPWSRQILTHTNYIAPYNFFINRLSLFPNQAIHDSRQLTDLNYLRDNWQAIREEALALSEEGQIKASDKLNDAGFNSFFRSGWKRFYLKWYDDDLPSAIERCPKTVELLKKAPSIKAAMFASLPPGGVLTPHRDPYPGALRYHLGLVTPNSDACFIKVDDQIHSWRDGEDVLFDETFIHLLKASATQNEESEKVGILNKVFEKAYNIRIVSRRLKKWNKPLYKTGKYALFALILYLIFF